MNLDEYANDFFGDDPQCLSCKHYQDNRKCAAFDWIPGDILIGKHDHTKPYPGDNEIMYEKK